MYVGGDVMRLLIGESWIEFEYESCRFDAPFDIEFLVVELAGLADWCDGRLAARWFVCIADCCVFAMLEVPNETLVVESPNLGN